MRIFWLPLFLVACLTTIDVKRGICWALCRQDGADVGSYELSSDSCICGRRQKFKAATGPVVKIKHVPYVAPEWDE